MYSKLFKAFREKSDNLDHWALEWWKPIFDCLESDNKPRKSYTYEYVLPRIMKLYPDGIDFCQKLSGTFSTIISCTKVARIIGYLNKNVDGNSLFGSLNIEILENALIHHDEQVKNFFYFISKY